MYDGMLARGKWAAIYFLALVTLGNYVLLNLLVAILVNGFQEQEKVFVVYIRYHIIGKF